MGEYAHGRARVAQRKWRIHAAFVSDRAGFRRSFYVRYVTQSGFFMARAHN
jgi:hypothetical protein